jgi:hypothetical protein
MTHISCLLIGIQVSSLDPDVGTQDGEDLEACTMIDLNAAPTSTNDWLARCRLSGMNIARIALVVFNSRRNGQFPITWMHPTMVVNTDQ